LIFDLRLEAVSSQPSAFDLCLKLTADCYQSKIANQKSKIPITGV
jgi:hypothetical protein